MGCPLSLYRLNGTRNPSADLHSPRVGDTVPPMTDQNPPPTRTVRVDTRKRVSLGKEATPGSMYFFEVREDGVITLTPAVAVPLGSLQI